jgi:4'-phosphopantetheinyl transferase EntD
VKDFSVAYHHATAHGVLTAVHLPDSPDPVPEHILASLPSAEAAHARTLRGYRQPQFVGGRIALRRACEQVGVRPTALLSDDRGAPVLPTGLSGSISHKRTIAVGMVARDIDGTLGVDIEEYAPARPTIEEHILVEEEQVAIADLAPDRKWMALLLRFSIKESIYKALDPHVRRHVGFHEAIVHPDLHGLASVRLQLANGEGPFKVDARYTWLHGRLLTSVRIQPTPTAPLA